MMNQFIFNCFNHFNSINNISPCYLLLCHCGPSLITLLGQRAPSCAIWYNIGPYHKHCRQCIAIHYIIVPSQIEMGQYIDASSYHNMQDSDTGIDTIFNVSIHRVLQYRIQQNFRVGKLLQLCTKHTIHWKTFTVHQSVAIMYCSQ